MTEQGPLHEVVPSSHPAHLRKLTIRIPKELWNTTSPPSDLSRKEDVVEPPRPSPRRSLIVKLRLKRPSAPPANPTITSSLTPHHSSSASHQLLASVPTEPHPSDSPDQAARSTPANRQRPKSCGVKIWRWIPGGPEHRYSGTYMHEMYLQQPCLQSTCRSCRVYHRGIVQEPLSLRSRFPGSEVGGGRNESAQRQSEEGRESERDC
ncbi:uncharacterized protein EI97DRAFT_262286 [Westerdykella ornata]|uniref:Uncharacterized protein n=1 Tax=Westerdykella ornata TaxID=318751 RepID=A0A6A6J5F4_WESOR|nr:uncharacterized protein EI97DRAFT_262286 [Westerdykella ornata]KAF2271622.1 hypothetical protein EI97DRAFT_262286 [Westerdykella ornata]